MSFKVFLFWSSGGRPVRRSKIIYAILKEVSWETFMWSYMEFGPVVQEDMSFKENVYGRTHDGRT